MGKGPDLSKNKNEAADMTLYNEEGVDLTLIRWMLSLSLEERLQDLQDHANSLLMMRREITIT